ncbi:MAG: TRZ/ATZ family hydrolase [bacterium]
MTESITQLLIPRWLIPVDESASVLEDHALVIADDRIADLGPLPTMRERHRAAEEIALPDHALLPGLVNAHTHAAMSLLRGYADDLPLMEWLQQHIWPAESAWVDAEFVEVGTDLALAEMIRGGTTCFNDMYWSPETTAARVERAGMRACIGMIVIDQPTRWAQSADEYIHNGLAMRDETRHSKLITTAFAPHAPYTVGDDALEKIRMLSDELDCRVHIHLHETAQEINESIDRYGVRPLERLGRLGLIGPRLTAVHMTQLLPGEIDSVAEHGVAVAHCPQSNLKLASGLCPVAQLQRRGVCVAIGTDSASSNNDLDMLNEMQTASLLAKGVGADPTALAAHDALAAATLGGAAALGLAHRIGSLAAGKQADCIAIDLSGASSAPVYHPLSQIVYSAARDQVSDVWVAGRRLLSSRSLTTLDEDEITRNATEFARKIQTQP